MQCVAYGAACESVSNHIVVGQDFGQSGGGVFVDEQGKRVVNYDDATACRTDRFAAFFRTMLDEGVVLPPAQFEAWFVSTAHNDEAIEKTIAAAAKAFAVASGI